MYCTRHVWNGNAWMLHGWNFSQFLMIISYSTTYTTHMPYSLKNFTLWLRLPLSKCCGSCHSYKTGNYVLLKLLKFANCNLLPFNSILFSCVLLFFNANKYCSKRRYLALILKLNAHQANLNYRLLQEQIKEEYHKSI